MAFYYSIFVVKHQVSLPTRYPMTIFKGSSRAHPSTPPLLQKCLYTQAVICIPHHEVTERYTPWKGSMAIATPISLGLSWPRNKLITTEQLGVASDRHRSFYYGVQTFTSWWLNQPIWKICLSNWIISPGFGVKIKNVWVATTQQFISFELLGFSFASELPGAKET